MRRVKDYNKALVLISKLGSYEASLNELMEAKKIIERQINLFNRKFYNRYDSYRYELGIDILINNLNIVDNYIGSLGYISFKYID